MVMLTCSTCGQELEPEFFYKEDSARGYSYRCKECCRVSSEKQKSADNYIRRQRGDFLFRKYGITLAEYEQMCLDREFKCDICGTQVEFPNVDHCHKTHVVRGLLCNPCNQALGLFKDNIESLEKAITYLKIERKPDLYRMMALLGSPRNRIK